MIFRSKQKNTESVALAVQRLAGPRLTRRCQFSIGKLSCFVPSLYHLGLFLIHLFLFLQFMFFHLFFLDKLSSTTLKVGEYLTFMEELSALRRHTVSEVGDHYITLHYTDKLDAKFITNNKTPGCCWEKQKHPSVGSLQCRGWQVLPFFF